MKSQVSLKVVFKLYISFIGFRGSPFLNMIMIDIL